MRVQNNSGSANTDWLFNLDTWYTDGNTSNADVSISYSTDNNTFTGLDSYATVNTGNAYIERDFSKSFNASVADGDYLYLQFSNIRPSGGSGSSVVIDNWTVAAIPEPSTFTFGLIGLAMSTWACVRRRRR